MEPTTNTTASPEARAWYIATITADEARKAAKRARAQARRLRRAQQTPQGLADQLQGDALPSEPITVNYRAVDGFIKTKKFATLPGAQRFAQRYVGETPELGQGYAVSADGIGRITASIPLSQLFPSA